MINKAHAIYYSPTGTSERVAESVAESFVRTLAEKLERGNVKYDAAFPESVAVADITLKAKVSELESTFAVIAAPVYGGRVAPTAVERLRKIKAKESLCAVIVLYGNRDYEDALLELLNEARNCGFIPVAAGAFIGEHSYSTEEYPIAQERPDGDDLEKCFKFGSDLALHYANLLEKSGGRKIAEDSFWQKLPLPQVKGNYPYKEYNPSPATPQTDTGRCVLCGRCIDMCPVSCIEMKNVVDMAGEYIVSDPNICTKCCACVKGCPFGARIYNTPYSERLHKNCSERKEPEWYFGAI